MGLHDFFPNIDDEVGVDKIMENVKKINQWQNTQEYVHRRALVSLAILWVLIFLCSTGCMLFAREAEMPVYSVSVTGSVRMPGVYHVPLSTRVSEAISMANFVEKMPADSTYINLTIAPLRNVVLHQKGKELSLDLLRFYRMGDLTQNPYLMDGDVIFVPAIKEQVTLLGAVEYRGKYELRAGDRLSDVLDLALGLRTDADLQQVMVQRYVGASGTENIMLDISGIGMHPDCKDNILLQNGDIVVIKSIAEYHPEFYIKIEGEVAHPGVYPIKNNETTLLEILEMSGGPTEQADLTRATVERKNAGTHADTEFQRLLNYPPAEFTNIEYEYMKTKFRQKDGKYTVSLARLWSSKDGKYDIPLQDSTYIYIPPIFNAIKVMGHVKNPGFVTYKPNQTISDYIEEAGGYSWNAQKRNVRVIRYATGEWLKPNKKTVLEPGDYVFVPERPPHDYLQYTKDVLTILAQAATIIIGINNITTK